MQRYFTHTNKIRFIALREDNELTCGNFFESAKLPYLVVLMIDETAIVAQRKGTEKCFSDNIEESTTSPHHINFPRILYSFHIVNTYSNCLHTQNTIIKIPLTL